MTSSNVQTTPFDAEVMLHWAQQARQQRDAFDAFAGYLSLNAANRPAHGSGEPLRKTH